MPPPMRLCAGNCASQSGRAPIRRRYFLRHLMLAAVADYPHIPICMHQDHGNNPQTCLSAITNNFTSVMMDGSLAEDAKTPADYDYNTRVTKQVCDMAHLIGVSVEGELGCLGSLETGEGDKEDGHGFEGKLDSERLLTDPMKPKNLSKKHKWTRWPSPSALHTALINLPANRTERFWR